MQEFGLVTIQHPTILVELAHVIVLMMERHVQMEHVNAEELLVMIQIHVVQTYVQIHKQIHCIVEDVTILVQRTKNVLKVIVGVMLRIIFNVLRERIVVLERHAKILRMIRIIVELAVQYALLQRVIYVTKENVPALILRQMR